MVRLNINGKDHDVDVDPNTPLLWAIRENVGLTGTKYGCGIAQCGACTVHLDGVATRSCSFPASAAVGKKIVTIEGLAQNGELHPIQNAFWEKHGLQCGFCTPGMIMAAADLLSRDSDPTDAEIRHAIEGNFCRCTGYHNIVAAIREAASVMREGRAAPVA